MSEQWTPLDKRVRCINCRYLVAIGGNDHQCRNEDGPVAMWMFLADSEPAQTWCEAFQPNEWLGDQIPLPNVTDLTNEQLQAEVVRLTTELRDANTALAPWRHSVDGYHGNVSLSEAGSSTQSASAKEQITKLAPSVEGTFRYATGIPRPLARGLLRDDANTRPRREREHSPSAVSGDQRQAGWQPISTAPKDGTLILLWESGDSNGYIDGRWRSGHWKESRQYKAGGCWWDGVYAVIAERWAPVPSGSSAEQKKE